MFFSIQMEKGCREAAFLFLGSLAPPGLAGVALRLPPA